MPKAHVILPANLCHDMNIACIHYHLQAHLTFSGLVFINSGDYVVFFAVLSFSDTHSQTLEVRPSIHLAHA